MKPNNPIPTTTTMPTAYQSSLLEAQNHQNVFRSEYENRWLNLIVHQDAVGLKEELRQGPSLVDSLAGYPYWYHLLQWPGDQDALMQAYPQEKWNELIREVLHKVQLEEGFSPPKHGFHQKDREAGLEKLLRLHHLQFGDWPEFLVGSLYLKSPHQHPWTKTLWEIEAASNTTTLLTEEIIKAWCSPDTQFSLALISSHPEEYAKMKGRLDEKAQKRGLSTKDEGFGWIPYTGGLRSWAHWVASGELDKRPWLKEVMNEVFAYDDRIWFNHPDQFKRWIQENKLTKLGIDESALEATAFEKLKAWVLFQKDPWLDPEDLKTRLPSSRKGWADRSSKERHEKIKEWDQAWLNLDHPHQRLEVLEPGVVKAFLILQWLAIPLGSEQPSFEGAIYWMCKTGGWIPSFTDAELVKGRKDVDPLWPPP